MAHRSRGVRSVALGLTLAMLGASGQAGARPRKPAPQPPAAPSEPAPPTAAELRAQGNEAMGSLRPADAIGFYKKSYELSPDATLLYNIGKALEALEDYPGALEQFERFARDGTPEQRKFVPKLDELIASMQAKVATLVLTCDRPHARVLVRGKEVGEVPEDGSLTIKLNSGPASIEIGADGYVPYRKDIQLPGGGTLELETKLLSKGSAGILSIRTVPDGSEVLVDGDLLGKAPVEATVTGGTHAIVARRRGFDDTPTSVVVQAGERKLLTVTLEQGVPLTSRWWFWTGVGVIVVAGVVVSIAALSTRSADAGNIPPGTAHAPLVRF